MKRDGRGFDHGTLETIRLMAVERVRDGERPSSVVASYGFNRTTIYRWLNAAAKPGVGLRALRSRPATGRPRSLTPHQEQQVFRWINGRDPRQYGLDFGLWTRSLVAELIERKFGIRLGVTAVGELLAKLGLTPQKPLWAFKAIGHSTAWISTNKILGAPRPNQSSASGNSATAGKGLNIAVSISNRSAPSLELLARAVSNTANKTPALYATTNIHNDMPMRANNSPWTSESKNAATVAPKVGNIKGR